MELRLSRDKLTDRATLGALFAAVGDGEQFLCYTLEDVVRAGPKVPGETAIPAGRYRVRLTWSDRFKRVLPLVCDVPGFTGIRIHAGNTAADTAGCPLVGHTRFGDRLQESRAALEDLLPRLEAWEKSGEVWLTVENAWT
jgi:hypothetical protein